MPALAIRPLTHLADIQAAEDVQRRAWNASDLEIVPAHLMHAAQHHGAVLLGAFDGERLVGFSFSILGRGEATGEGNISTSEPHLPVASPLQLYSAITGVLPEYQSEGVGYQLKLAQRESALRLGIQVITWTYDPLESRNGWFNVGKLGAVCRRYLRDFHGPLSGLNAGLSTDRFHVEWWIASEHAQRRLSGGRPPSFDTLLAAGATVVNEATFTPNGLPISPSSFILHPSSLLLVEIPADFQAIKQRDFPLALAWREHTGRLFETLFQRGCQVSDFARRTDEDGRERSYYVVKRET
ncbi:MAG: hypothetical protein AB1791_21005 [Chloroflexota bacterium]